MSDIVKSLRKHQKMIILVAALGVISMYVMPLDQIFAASTGDLVKQRLDTAIDRTNAAFDRGIDRVQNSGSPQAYKIVENLENQQDRINQHLTDLQYRLLG